MSPEHLAKKEMYPEIPQLRAVSAKVGAGVQTVVVLVVGLRWWWRCQCEREDAAVVRRWAHPSPPRACPAAQVAAAVAEAAFASGVSSLVNAPDSWLEYVSTRMFTPRVCCGRWSVLGAGPCWGHGAAPARALCMTLPRLTSPRLAPCPSPLQGRTTKVAGMPQTRSTANLSHLHISSASASDLLASAHSGDGGGHTRSHPAHHPSGLPVHP